MRYISLFSGIEAASVAWRHLGWEPVAFSEIEPFPCELLKQKYPDVPNLGDITEIDWKPYAGSVDIIVGGSPCQSFSIAGTRSGLDGQSGLMWEYCRAIRELRPRYLVWENVPGALSSKTGDAPKGSDFECLLNELDDLGYGLAWRVLDAQFFGVPQRRRRVFLVGCLENPERAGEILFERESLRWDNPSSREKRKSLAERVKSSLRGSCFRSVGFSDNSPSAGSIGADIEIAPTMRAGANLASVPSACYCSHTVAYLPFDLTQITNPDNGNNPRLGDPCHTLATTGRSPNVVCMASGQAHAEIMEECCPAQMARQYKDPPIVSFPWNAGGFAAGTAIEDGTSPTIRSTHNGAPAVAEKNDEGYIVRRLMPRECERLQGFPDGWTDIEFRRKPASDTARYKALGNSMAVPVMEWIGRRINEMEITNGKTTA